MRVLVLRTGGLLLRTRLVLPALCGRCGIGRWLLNCAAGLVSTARVATFHGSVALRCAAFLCHHFADGGGGAGIGTFPFSFHLPVATITPARLPTCSVPFLLLRFCYVPAFA